MKIWKNFQILFSSAYELQLLIHPYFTPLLPVCQYVDKIFYSLIILAAALPLRGRLHFIPVAQLPADAG